NVLFVKRDAKGEIEDSFTLVPKAQNNPNMGLISEPSTRHFIHKDVFTHINHESGMDKEEPFSGFKNDTVNIGQTFLTTSGKIKIRVDSVTKHHFSSYLILKLSAMATSLNDSVRLNAMYVRDTATAGEEGISDQSDMLGVLLKFDKVNYDKNGNAKFQVFTGERAPRKPYIVLKTIEFPWINLVWAGTIIMVLGFAMAVVFRSRQLKALSE
ncbi:MAG: hypothetical protein IT244_11710, partial [Bacteroidia bacterium]|nr:hypothetical protein [Bacteroidia bacterium]